MIIRFDIQPKSFAEYCDVMDMIGDFLDTNNIEHKKYELQINHKGEKIMADIFIIAEEIKKDIEESYESQSPQDAFKFAEGFITGLKRYAVINLKDFTELNNYNHNLFLKYITEKEGGKLNERNRI
jgi:hypothetical protein